MRCRLVGCDCIGFVYQDECAVPVARPSLARIYEAIPASQVVRAVEVGLIDSRDPCQR